MARQPMQPIEKGADGVIRFRRNAIVELLLNTGQLDMNKLALLPFSDDDRMQFAQLIGYSVSGFGELSYAAKDVIDEADEIANIIWENAE